MWTCLREWLDSILSFVIFKLQWYWWHSKQILNKRVFSSKRRLWVIKQVPLQKHLPRSSVKRNVELRQLELLHWQRPLHSHFHFCNFSTGSIQSTSWINDLSNRRHESMLWCSASVRSRSWLVETRETTLCTNWSKLTNWSGHTADTQNHHKGPWKEWRYKVHQHSCTRKWS